MIPKSIKPMLAVKAPQPFDSKSHIFEIKFNGIRAIAFIENGKLRLQSRNLRNITDQFPELLALPNQLKGDKIVFDGEIVVLDRDRPSLEGIQSRIQKTDPIKINYAARNFPVTYLVFDLLYENGQCLMAKPLIERKARLQALLLNSERIKVVQFVEREGIRFFEAAKSLDLEGIMAKRKNSPYLSGKRSKSWQKIK